jgi:hypothetical protein
MKDLIETFATHPWASLGAAVFILLVVEIVGDAAIETAKARRGE